MKVQTKSLNFLRGETKIEIPFFQRPYVWKYENAKLLLQDLFRTNGNHFLGSILLKLEDNDSEDENVTSSKQVVIDGWTTTIDNFKYLSKSNVRFFNGKQSFN